MRGVGGRGQRVGDGAYEQGGGGYLVSCICRVDHHDA